MTPEQQLAALARESKSSIELSVDAKGVYRWTIKVYYEAGEEIGAVTQLTTIDGRLREKFGGGGG